MALEALLADLPGGPADPRPELQDFRGDIGEAANAALRGDPPARLQRGSSRPSLAWRSP